MPLYSYAFFSGRDNKADSEDLVSETFIRAMLSWDEKGSLRAWMFRVLENLFIDEPAKKRFMTDGDDFLQTVPDQRKGNREEQEQQDSERQWLLKQIQMMRVSDQELMILTLYSGFNDAELAEHLQIQHRKGISE